MALVCEESDDDTEAVRSEVVVVRCGSGTTNERASEKKKTIVLMN